MLSLLLLSTAPIMAIEPEPPAILEIIDEITFTSTAPVLPPRSDWYPADPVEEHFLLVGEILEPPMDPFEEQALMLEIAERVAEERRIAEAEEARRKAEEEARLQREEEERKKAEEAAAKATPPPAPASSTITNWDKWYPIAKCESGYGGEPNWSINTGNGYYGGLQFDLSSWEWAGGHRYSVYPHHATAAQQIEIAERLLAIHPAGWGAWPACSKKAGYR